MIVFERAMACGRQQGVEFGSRFGLQAFQRFDFGLERVEFSLYVNRRLVYKALANRHDASKLIADINLCETELRQKFPKVTWIFLKPDNTA